MALRTGPCFLLLALSFLTGCGKEERTEAIRLSKLLASKQADFESANMLEKDVMDSARAWCGAITANGAGRDAELDQNARVATELAKSVVAISAHLSGVRQAIDGESFQKEYPRSVRSDLITRLTKRQRMLQDVRMLLEQSAPQFLAYRQSRAYAGDTYPDGIGKLDALLRTYKPPDNILAPAVGDIKEKYKIKAGEM